MTSDHLIIRGYLPTLQTEQSLVLIPVESYKFGRQNHYSFLGYWHSSCCQSYHYLHQKRLKRLLKRLFRALENALKAVRKSPNRQNGISAPWWTKVCKLAELEYQDAVEISERYIRAKEFRNSSFLNQKRALEKKCRRHENFPRRTQANTVGGPSSCKYHPSFMV